MTPFVTASLGSFSRGEGDKGIDDYFASAKEIREYIMQIIEPLLIGNYRIVQDTGLYRFTSDSVLLSRFVKAKAGELVADFCAGCGIVGLHFFAENTGIRHVTLFELQKEMAELARRTVELNGLYDLFTVENIAVQDIPPRYIEAFSLILCNPPYEKGGFENADPKKAVCRKELALPLEELVASAARCLKFGGRFALVHRADRLSELFCTLHAAGLEPKKLQLVAGKEGAKPYLALVMAKKGGKSGLEVLPTLANTAAAGRMGADAAGNSAAGPEAAEKTKISAADGKGAAGEEI